ncbi:peptidase inhibitor I78 family protein [Pseudoxanthomonas sp. 3HH-4]|uniref:I78 family peptidase inhibitor n=1 Tax=Pseudoxanthomonas sp. 3HH-4 TaxID=1690214 RepID=UPI0011758AD1|nr:I78 family peptidase inhibitor [Pseudoxanthomonas sp. 3HH-4]TQM12119.1 peptidase inhibitor I78 family protein [Pseudoxanthomonas sp. 3HH-4]
MNKVIISTSVAGLLSMSGCVTEGPPQASVSGRCSTEGTEWAMGKSADEATGRRLFQQSGAGLWRIITPDRAVLADYRDDRLTVNVDAANKIIAIRCG